MTLNAAGCCVVGHPDYYRELRFVELFRLVLEGVPPEVFFVLSFDGASRKARLFFTEDSKRMDSRKRDNVKQQAL